MTFLFVVLTTALPAFAQAEQAAQPASAAAGRLDVSGGGDRSGHSCAISADAAARCWGFGGEGRLGYADTKAIGDDETPGSVGPVDLGPGRTARAVSAGAFHTCALLDDGTMRCWGFGGEGRLGYANTNAVGDDESPGTVGAVDLGAGRTAQSITAGGGHTCAVLDGGSVRCWGFGGDGRLGYASRSSIGDDETPGVIGPVDLGAGRTAVAVSAGQSNSCALLDNGAVRCWGFGANGQLGYGNTRTIGDDESPGAAGAVDLGSGLGAKAISAGAGHTCAVLEDGSVRCWGFGGNGRLGYADTRTVGDDEPPGSVGPVDLGPGRTAIAISAGDAHTCALLDVGAVRCWGFGANGRLGNAGTSDIGDDETPGSVGPVDLGPGRTATAISAGGRHTCALLDDGAIRCWGEGAHGRLGYCNTATVGDDEAPAAAGPVDLGVPGAAAARCASPPPAPDAPPGPAPGPATPLPAGVPLPPAPGAVPAARDPMAAALAAQKARATALRACLRDAAALTAAERRSARRGHASRRARSSAIRRAARRAVLRRSRCLTRHGRTPGRVSRFAATATGRRTIKLTFRGAGTDASKLPAARNYVIKQSRRPVRTSRDFRRATALCKGTCRFKVTEVGARLTLTVTGLARRSTYYYVIAARDNVSSRIGRRSTSVRARTR